MASKSSDLKTILAMSWLAKIPSSNRGSTETSQSFSLWDDKWFLRLSYCLDGHHSPEYHLTLIRGTRRENLKRCFRVTAFCDFQCNDNSGVNKQVYSKLVNTPTEVICTINNSILSRPTYIRSKEITVVCIFHDILSPSPEQKSVKAPSDLDLESLTLDFGDLLKDSTFADVELRCEDLTVPAHKTILSARSEVFAAMFRNEMAENITGVVELKDLDARVLKLFLWYMYTGEAPNSPSLVQALYVAGDKYAVHALKKSCSKRMVDCLTEENCFAMLMLADAHADADFKAQVIAFICSHEKVLLKGAWKKFCEDNSLLAVEVYQNFAKRKIEV